MRIAIAGRVEAEPVIRESIEHPGRHQVFVVITVGVGCLWSLKHETFTLTAARLLVRQLRPGSAVSVEAHGASPLSVDGRNVLRFEGVIEIGSPSRSYL